MTGSVSDDSRELHSEDDGVRLDVLGVLDGVDKASLRGGGSSSWDYLRHFAPVLQQYQHQAINVLEIGVASGASLNLWLRYFSKATIIGVDIDPACASFSRERVRVEIGSQDDKEFTARVARAYPPTVVIDDGSHVGHHIICSFEVLFPLLTPGGTYIVEDLAFHFARKDTEVVAAHPWFDPAGELVFNYFSRLIAAKAAHVTILKDSPDHMNEVYRTVDSICVVGGALIVRKKAPRDLAKYVAVFEDELRARAANGRSHYNYAAGRYAEFLIIYQYKVDRAVQLLEALVGLEPSNWMARKLLYKALTSLGKSEAASKVSADLLAQDQDVNLPETFVREWMIYPH
jgi:hypothetical protein